MAYDGTLVFDTRIDTKGFGKGIDTLKGKTEGLSASLKKLGALIASVFAVQQLVNFGKQAIELGSNVTEVQNVVDVAFGDMAYMVDEFAKSAIENFGMSQLAAKKTASTYMAMARGMGVAMDTAAEMSLTLTGLSGDVASFYNISQEEAAYKLQSVFTGETESLKELGIVMTEVNLEQYAMANGMNSNIRSMTQAQRVALNYAFVTDQLALASGDFIRTQDSWANQTRILSMLWQEFMSIVGQALIQVLLPVVQTLNQIVSSLISMANALNAALSSIFGGANTQIQQTQAEVGGVSSGIGNAVENQEALTDATKETNKEQKKSLSTFDEINKLSTQTAASDGGGGGGTGGISAGATSVPALETKTVEVQAVGGEKLIELFDRLKQAVEPTVQAVGRLWEELKRVGSFAGDALVDFYNNFLVPVGSWVLGEGLPRLIDALANGLAAIDFQRINDSLNNLWTALAPFAIHVGEGLLWFWENVLVPLGTWVGNEIVPRFLDSMATLIKILDTIIQAAQPAFEWLWDTFLKPLAEFTGGIILTLLDEFNGWLKIIAGVLTGDFKLAVEGARDIVDAWGQKFTLVKDLASEAWKGIKETLSPVIEWFNNNIIDPIAKNFKNFMNKLIGYAEGFVNFFIRGINGIISAFNSIRVTIPDWVPGIGGNSFGVNIPNVSEISLPRLAQGAVIPPNREFMAVLGDQKQGTNIETPLDTMVQAFKQALAESGYSGHNEAYLVLNEQVLGKVVYRLNNKESRRVGVRLQGV